jgi:hypothetical protein
MKKIIQLIKSWQLKQVFVIFLAGSLLFISTACSQGKVASTRNNVERQLADTYDKYDANQPSQGGMNVYNDDPRYDNPEVQAKTKALIDRAKSRNAPYDNVGEYFDRVTDEAGANFNDAKEDISKGFREGSRNLKNNVDNATNNLKNAADDTAQSTQNTVKDLKNKVQDLT